MTCEVKRSNETDETLWLVQKSLRYEAKTGLLTWKERPREHFKNERGWRAFNSCFANKIAGANRGIGYIEIPISTKTEVIRLYAHRIAFALIAGRWPRNQIDHRNGNPSDNREENLREATPAQNQHNIAKSRALMGVSRGKSKSKPWRANIRANGVSYRLGDFVSAEDAHAAYLAAKAELHTFQPTLRTGEE